MLSLSAENSKADIDLGIVNGDDSTASNVPYSSGLMRFAEAVAGRDPRRISEARQALLDDYA